MSRPAPSSSSLTPESSSTSSTPSSSSSSGARPTPSSAPKLVVARIREWKPIGVWKFARGVNDTCPICQMPLTQKCITCQVEEGRSCGLIYGKCGHVFHTCCIEGWVKKNESQPQVMCPYCFTPWQSTKQEYNHC